MGMAAPEDPVETPMVGRVFLHGLQRRRGLRPRTGTLARNRMERGRHRGFGSVVETCLAVKRPPEDTARPPSR